MEDMERDDAPDKLAAVKMVTLRLADMLGLKLEDGRRLRIATEPPLQNESASDRKDLRIAMARSWAKAMLMTDQLLGAELTGSPAFAILIDLYVSAADRRQVAISDASCAGRVPPTTGLRWVKVLESRGFIYRQDDPTDRRRVFLRLTSLGIETLEAVLDRTAESNAANGLGRLSLIE